MKSQRKNRFDDWRLPKSVDEQTVRLANIVKIKNINHNSKTAEFKKATKFIKAYGYKRAKNTVLFIKNNFQKKEIKIDDIIKTYNWEKKFRVFLKEIIEELEITFSNAILTTLTWNNTFWTKKYPNFETAKIFQEKYLKKANWVFNQIQTRFWRHKEEILELEKEKTKKIKLDNFFIWDLFDKATFGDLTIIYNALKKPFKRQVIKRFWKMKNPIKSKTLANFEDSVKFLKFLRNKIYHNEQLYSTNITKHLCEFNLKIVDKKLTAMDKIIYSLLYIFPKSQNHIILKKIKEIKTKEYQYMFISTTKKNQIIKCNMWEEKI